MIPDTSADMVLGFAVILGVLLVYTISIFLRARAARRILKDDEAED
ncbi:hypothetical protein KQH50_00965 [bacterium]|nr:hypothetical protein [bacterium]